MILVVLRDLILRMSGCQLIDGILLAILIKLILLSLLFEDFSRFYEAFLDWRAIIGLLIKAEFSRDGLQKDVLKRKKAW